MASSKEQLVCHVCGFANAPNADRCVSCGAKLEELAGGYGEADDAHAGKRRGFSPVWAAVSFGLYLFLEALALVVLPLVVSSYDPQGFTAILVSASGFIVGAIVLGLATKGRWIESSIGMLLTLGPTIGWLVYNSPQAPAHLGGGFALGFFDYAVLTMFAVFSQVIVAYIGSRGQAAMKVRTSTVPPPR
ncbi:MAG: zinc finger Ran-binding domain-containing protein [Sandaracinaceae bacterium]|nr:zinc finger Ran-binding domain-containing protein [Sandaracinaceae bacterium]